MTSTLMSFLYTQYHTILHGRSILATITIYTAVGTTPLYASTRPRRPQKGTNASSHEAPPRMILPLLPHSRPFVKSTQIPLNSTAMPICWSVLRSGISQLHSIECRNGSPPVTDPDGILVLSYNMRWLMYTTNCSIPPNYPVYCLLLLVSYMLHYPVLFCLPISSPWSKLMIDTLMNGMINR